MTAAEPVQAVCCHRMSDGSGALERRGLMGGAAGPGLIACRQERSQKKRPGLPHIFQSQALAATLHAQCLHSVHPPDAVAHLRTRTRLDPMRGAVAVAPHSRASAARRGTAQSEEWHGE